MPTRELAIHAAATWFMVGLIWLVQVVHYPMFGSLDRAGFRRSHAFHSNAITFVVLPPMVVELMLSAMLAWRGGLQNHAAAAGFVLVVLIWAVTFLVMVPLHGRLQAGGYEERVHADLVRWNWVRTAAWTARGLIVLFWL
jgi:hypothetical protein